MLVYLYCIRRTDIGAQRHLGTLRFGIFSSQQIIVGVDRNRGIIGMRSRLEYIGRIFLCRQSEAGTNAEILERFPLPVKIFGNRCITGLVFTVQIGIQQRIVNIRTILFDQRTVGIINAPIGIHFGIITERAVRRIFGTVIVYR